MSVRNRPRWPCAPLLRLEYTDFSFALISFCSLWNVLKVGLSHIGVGLAFSNKVSM